MPPTSRPAFLPPPGRERLSWIVLAAILLLLKALALLHFRIDSDETQHAHVVWAWTRGLLPYRDVFDNHMPLFQAMCAPLFALLGQHPFIIAELRCAMLPLWLLSLWAVFALTASLFSKRLAPWAALAAAALPPFFYTSTEFRPDCLWAALWLISLFALLDRPFTLRRALSFGLLLGAALSVSMKTAELLLALLIATAIALLIQLAARRAPSFPWRGVPLRLLLILAGAILLPGAILIYFGSKGALGIMHYCVLTHNVLPGLKRWGHPSAARWLFPTALPLLAAYGWFVFRQAQDPALGLRRVILLLTPCLVAVLLISYSPEMTRENDLPWTPLLPLLPIPILLALRPRFPQLDGCFFRCALPVVILVELLCVWHAAPLRTNRVRVTENSIRDVLLLTGPADYVMDAKGDYVFRPRPYWWAFETVTKARARKGLIPDLLPQALARTATTLCYLYSEHVSPAATRFILANYIPFDPAALDLGAAGKQLPAPAVPGAPVTFQVAIPAVYSIVSEQGSTAGLIDGRPLDGPLLLQPGSHTFLRTSGSGRAAILLARAVQAGFKPLFDDAQKISARESARSSSSGD